MSCIQRIVGGILSFCDQHRPSQLNKKMAYIMYVIKKHFKSEPQNWPY
jgi:hypothetical protein